MKQQITNFSRFFASFNELPCYCGSREEFKKEIVSQYTFGRTESLKEMTWQEYNDCCDGLEKLSGRKERLKRNRSICLKLIQEIGVDTTDWQRINEFCKHPRICGKEFARIRLDEMEDFQRKTQSNQEERRFERERRREQSWQDGDVYPFGWNPSCLKIQPI